jgi:hypothetical protein
VAGQPGGSRIASRKPMALRSLPDDLTPEDRAPHAAWVRLIAISSGCAVLLLLGLLLALGIPGDNESASGTPAGLTAPGASGGRPGTPAR